MSEVRVVSGTVSVLCGRVSFQLLKPTDDDHKTTLLRRINASKAVPGVVILSATFAVQLRLFVDVDLKTSESALDLLKKSVENLLRLEKIAFDPTMTTHFRAVTQRPKKS